MKLPARLAALLLATLATLTVSVALAACGSGGDNASAGDAGAAKHEYPSEASTVIGLASPPLTKSEFLAHMNKVCRYAWRRLAHNWNLYMNTLGSKGGRKARFADGVQHSLLLGVVLLIFDDIQMLGSPRGDEKTVEEIIGPMYVAAKSGESGQWRAHSAPELVSHFATYNQHARRYGLRECLVEGAHLRQFKP